VFCVHRKEKKINRKIGPHDRYRYGDKGIDVYNNDKVAVRSDQLLVALSHMFSTNDEATAVRRPAKVATARRPGRSLLSGHRRRRSAVFGRQRSSTVYHHVQQ